MIDVNQYGSILEITDDTDHKIVGTFRTALDDSGFHGQTIAMLGVHQGDCISVAGGGRPPTGDAVVCYTGLCATAKWKRSGSSAPTARSMPSKGNREKSSSSTGGAA
jgi:hypothetical protein